MNRLINFIHLFWINLTRNFFKELALGIGVTLATLTIIIGTSLGNGLETIHKNSVLRELPVDRIQLNGTMEVSGLGPNNINIGPLKIKPTKKVYNISNKIIKEIENWAEVKKVVPFSRANFPITLYVSGGSSQNHRPFVLFLEPPVIGIPNSMAMEYIEKYKDQHDTEAIKKDFPKGFNKYNGQIPILVPNLVSNVGSNFFKTNFLPNFNILSFASGLDITLVMNHSHFLSGNPVAGKKPVKVKIIGYVDTNLTPGIAIPQEILEQAKQSLLPKDLAKGFESVIIYAKNPKQVNTLKNKLLPYLKQYKLEIEENSLLTKISNYVDKGIRSFQSLVQIFSVLVLFITGIGIFYAFLYLFIKRENEMGLYRFFGGTHLEIILILVLESGFIALICSLAGYFLSFYIITSYLPNHIESFIQILPSAFQKLVSNLDIKEAFQFKAFANLKYVFVSVLFCVAAALFPALIGSFRPIKRN